MPNFALKQIESVKGKQKLYNLSGWTMQIHIILYNYGKDNTYKSGLKTLYYYMTLISDLGSLPDTKFKPISKGKNEEFKEYELKSKNLRIYLFHEEKTGKIVVFGGIKKS